MAKETLSGGRPIRAFEVRIVEDSQSIASLPNIKTDCKSMARLRGF
jgi:hypothetical protein